MSSYPEQFTHTAEPVQQDSAFAQYVPAVSLPKPSKRRLKSDDERLAEALASVETLQAKVVAVRDEKRLALIEELYAKHSIQHMAGDASEAKRLAKLRQQLGL